MCIIYINVIQYLQGRVKFPIGGIVRERKAQERKLVIWCDSKTDSIVWMEEDEASHFL